MSSPLELDGALNLDEIFAKNPEDISDDELLLWIEDQRLKRLEFGAKDIEREEKQAKPKKTKAAVEKSAKTSRDLFNAPADWVMTEITSDKTAPR